MICPACNTENRQGAKFCNECGLRLAEDPMLDANTDPTESLDAAAAQEREDQVACAEQDQSSNCQDGELSATESGEYGSESNYEVEGDYEDAANGSDQLQEQDLATEEARANADETESADPSNEIDLEALKNPNGLSLTEEFDFSDYEGEDPESGEANEDPSAHLQETLPDPGRPRKKHPRQISAAETSEIPVVGDPSELLVDHFKLPESAWKPSDTLEMPRIEGAEEPSNRAFIAPDSNSKEARKAAKLRKKEQKRAAREERKNTTIDAHGNPRVPWSVGKKVGTAVLVLALAGGATAAATYSMQLWGGKSVPNVEGLSEADAIYLLQSEGFQIATDQVPSDEVEGVVLISDPASGSRIAEGSEVMLHVSTSRTIPKIKGMTEEEALAALKEAGYENIGNNKTEKRNDSEGIVLNVQPKTGAKAKSSEKITLTVSEYYRVPDVKGKTSEQALGLIEKAGYNANLQSRVDKSVEPGTVISTKPAAEKRLKSGSTVTVYVSISREEQLEEAARKYLANGTTVQLKSASYIITSLDEVRVNAEKNQVGFTITGQPFTDFLGQTIYLPAQAANGILTFDPNGTDVIAVD